MNTEAIEKAQERMQRRVDPSVFKPVVVHTIIDLRRVLRELDPAVAPRPSTVQVTTRMPGHDSNGKPCTYMVSAPTESHSKRDIILQGFDAIHRQLEVAAKRQQDAEPVIINGKPSLPPVTAGACLNSWVDPLIERWLGGKRNGELIQWTVQGEVYEYDIWQHRLWRRTELADQHG